MASKTTHALTLVSTPEFAVGKSEINTLQKTAVDMVYAIGRMESNAAKGAVLAGFQLHRVKLSLEHGAFGPWLETIGAKRRKDETAEQFQKRTTGADLPAIKERQINYYMRLTLAFLEKARLAKKDILDLPGDITAVDLEGHAKLAESLTAFVGDLSLNELLIKHGIKGVGMHTALTAGEDTEQSPAEKLRAAQEQIWQETFSYSQMLRAVFAEPDRAQLLNDPKQIELLLADIEETKKLARERLDTLRATAV